MKTQRITKRHVGRFVRKFNRSTSAGHALQMLTNLKANPKLWMMVKKNWR